MDEIAFAVVFLTFSALAALAWVTRPLPWSDHAAHLRVVSLALTRPRSSTEPPCDCSPDSGCDQLLWWRIGRDLERVAKRRQWLG